MSGQENEIEFLDHHDFSFNGKLSHEYGNLTCGWYNHLS